MKFVDISEERRGDSAQRHDRLVQRYFMEFMGCAVTALRGKSDPELKEVYGKFANFLFQKKQDTGVPGWQTAMNYLSALSQVFKKELFHKQRGIFMDEEWYNGVRSTLSKKYISRSREMGEALVESPDPLTDELLSQLCSFLYDKNTAKSMKDRAFLLNQWHLLGRVSEVSYLRNRFLEFSPSAGALLLNMVRMKGNKIGKPTFYALFVHHNSWLKCVLHGMGSSFILNQETSDEDDFCYPDIPRGEKVSTYVNGVLREFVTSTEKKINLSSHSGRHGAAAEADCNPTVSVTWIVERGEWMMDRISTAFEYIFGNSRNDRKVARALAGWPDCSAGGLPPLIQDLHEPELEATLSDLAQDLFSQTVPISLKEMLLSVQLYRFGEVYEYNPRHILVSRIVRSASNYNLQVEDLLSVGRRLFQSFQRRNLGQLSIEESPQCISGRLNRLTEVILETRVEVNEQLSEIRRELHQEIRSLREAVLQQLQASSNVIPASPAATISEDIHGTHAEQDHGVNFSNVVEERQFPSHLVKLSGITVADAYFEFVRWGLSTCSTANKQEYKAWIDLRKLYTLARELEPSFCEIPDPPVFHGQGFREWRDQVKPKIHEAAVKLHEQIESHSNQVKEIGSSSRKRKLTNKATASLKRMRAMVGEAVLVDIL